jgi:FtsH-binding integral membrane protein
MTHAHAHVPAAEAVAGERATFIVKTYLHLLGAIMAFVIGEAALFVTGIAERIAGFILAGPLSGQFGWLVVLGAFMAVSYIADRWARSDSGPGMQYLGLAMYVGAEILIFVPLLYVAATYSSPDVIPTAGLVTLILFGGLTATVFITRKDFSFLRGILVFGGFAALGLIVASIVIGFSLGNLFCWAILALACGYVLYHTGNVLHHYRTDQHVAASLALFASIALIFWYVLRLFMSRD